MNQSMSARGGSASGGKKILTFRLAVQLIILGIVLFLTLGHIFYGVEKYASIDAYCPFGAVESFITTATTGEYLKRIYTSSFLLWGIVLLGTFFLGRTFCSYICPLGALQEWIRKSGKKMGIKKDVELPKSIDKYARYVKYIILAVILYYSYVLGDLVFRNYDPYNALMHLGNEFDEKMWAYGILAVVLISALFSKSWWCRDFCSLGAFFGVLKKFSLFKIKRDQSSCTACGLCDKNCPAGLNIKDSKAINSADCISCLECVSHCASDSLSANVGNKKISKKNFGYLAAALFFVPLLIVMATPYWQTSAPSNIVNEIGTIDTSNIRGSNLLETVVKDSGVPLEVFIKELGLPENVDVKMKLKEIGPAYDLKNSEGAVLETEDFRAVIDNVLKK